MQCLLCYLIKKCINLASSASYAIDTYILYLHNYFNVQENIERIIMFVKLQNLPTELNCSYILKTTLPNLILLLLCSFVHQKYCCNLDSKHMWVKVG